MSGAETARRPVVQRRIGGAETTAPKWPSPLLMAYFNDLLIMFNDSAIYWWRSTLNSDRLPRWKKTSPIADASLGIIGVQLKAPLEPLAPSQHSIISKHLSGALNFAPIMPGEVSLPDCECEFFFQSWMTSGHSSGSSLVDHSSGLSHREIFPKPY